MKFFFPFLLFVLCSCDVNNVSSDSNLDIYRFENHLFSTTEANASVNKNIWDKELGDFSHSYYSFIANTDYRSDSLFNNQLFSFITNADMREVYDTINNKFKDFSNIKIQLDYAFSEHSRIFPNYPTPKIITMFSGFNYGVVIQDSLIAIGLDFYLGKNSVFYERLGDPEYLRFQKQSKFMLPNIMEAWYDSFFSRYNKKSNLLSELIYKGKIMFLLSKTLPKHSMEDRLRFSKSELNWCMENESLIWTFLIENNLLFSTRDKDYRSYLNYSPFSKGMTQESPSRIAYFIGYEIVNKYMNINSDISLNDLMLQNDHMLILNKSKYKP